MRKRQALAAAFAQMSPVNWQHINLQGEFDFSNETLTDALRCGQFVLLTIFCTKRSGQFLNVLFFPFPEGTPYRGEQMNAVMGELHYYFTFDDEVGYQRFRTSFLEEDGAGALEVLSYPSECRRPPMKVEHFQAYGHLKFRQISAFIDESQQN